MGLLSNSIQKSLHTISPKSRARLLSYLTFLCCTFSAVADEFDSIDPINFVDPSNYIDSLNSSDPIDSINSFAIELEAQAIVALESEYGPYDFRLQEPLGNLGRQLQEAGKHEEALIAFDRALHVTRINRGLYDESQIEVVDSLIESNSALANWDSVDRHYRYLQHLYRRLYHVDDPRLEIGLQKVVSWHVSALNVNLDGKRIEHLRQANKLFKLRLEVAGQTLTAGHPRFEFLEQNIKICEYQLYLASDLNKEMLRRQERTRRSRTLADLD